QLRDAVGKNRRAYLRILRQIGTQTDFWHLLTHDSPQSVIFCCRGDSRNKHNDLEHDVIKPVARKRRVGFAHRAISHVVTGLPSLSLPSFRTTPIAASSSRMRS